MGGFIQQQDKEVAAAVRADSTGEALKTLLREKAGIDVALNDAQPSGDGDQSPIRDHSKQQYIRFLWAEGGDFYERAKFDGKLGVGSSINYYSTSLP